MASNENVESSDLTSVKSDSSLRRQQDDPEGVMRPELFKSLFQEIVAVCCCSLAVGASSITTGFTTLSLSKIAEDFDVSGGSLTWSTGSIGLGVGASLLIMGGVSDAFGRKKSILVSFTLYAVLNLVCGFLHNFIALCIVRALIGVFVSLATPSLAGILGSTYKPGTRKNRALLTFSAGAPLGYVGGLLIGGVATDRLSWRAGHWFLLIVYLILVPLVYYNVPLDPPLKRQESWQLLKKLDYVGAFISLSGFTLFCFSMTQVDSTEKGWKTPYILATFLIGFFLIVSLAFYETYVPQMPIMPMQLWKNLNFALAMLIMALNWAGFQGCLSFYSVLYFEEIRNYSPLHTALCVLTMGVGGIMVNFFALMTLHLIPGTVLMCVACTLFLGLAIIWETMDIGRSYWLGPFWLYLLAVIGADLSYNVANLVTLNAVDSSLQSSAAGVFNTVIQLAGTVGLGISSALVSARYDLYGTDLETKYPTRLYDGFRNAFWLAFGCGCVSLLTCPFLRIGVSTATSHLKDEETQLVEELDIQPVSTEKQA